MWRVATTGMHTASELIKQSNVNSGGAPRLDGGWGKEEGKETRIFGIWF